MKKLRRNQAPRKKFNIEDYIDFSVDSFADLYLYLWVGMLGAALVSVGLYLFAVYVL